MSDTIFPEPMDQMDRAMQRMDKKAWAEADAEIATLKARLAEAERAIDRAGKCLVMSNNGAREALEILQRYKRTADSASGVQK